MRKKHETAMQCLSCLSPARRRGLCDKHYERFRRARNELPLEFRAKYEAMAVERKMILPKVENRKLVKNDEFVNLATELILTSEGSAGIGEQLDEQAIKMVAEGEAEFKKPRKKKDGK